jgi:hypothetical protein
MTAGRKTISANARESFFWVKVDAARPAEEGVEGVAVGVPRAVEEPTETEGKPPGVPVTMEDEAVAEGKGESMPEVMTGPGARVWECEGACDVWMLTDDMVEGFVKSASVAK